MATPIFSDIKNAVRIWSTFKAQVAKTRARNALAKKIDQRSVGRSNEVGALLLALCACLTAPTISASDTVNGSWRVNETLSDDYDEVAKELSDKLHKEYRQKQQQKFINQENLDHAERTRRRIREERREFSWTIPEHIEQMLHAQTLRIHNARKVVLLYDSGRKRLLTVNPAGRAYSVRGTEISKDDVGTSLTYFDEEALIVETDVRYGGKMVERFERAEEGRLRVVVRVQEPAGGPWLEYVRFFDPQS
ncbi:MAG: hypothetical protein AAF384_07095 [Pseudomonadota bacterium]